MSVCKMMSNSEETRKHQHNSNLHHAAMLNFVKKSYFIRKLLSDCQIQRKYLKPWPRKGPRY